MDVEILLYNDGWSLEDKQNILAYMKKQESFQFVNSHLTLFWSLLYYLKQTVVSTVIQCSEEQKNGERRY